MSGRLAIVDLRWRARDPMENCGSLGESRATVNLVLDLVATFRRLKDSIGEQGQVSGVTSQTFIRHG